MAKAPATAFIALGANVGDRHANIAAAVAQLDDPPALRRVRVSSLMENAAVGGPPDAPAFLNGVAEVQTTLQPLELLHRLLQIEQSLGRVRRQKWEPRPIDLDLILYDDRIIQSPELTVPHPLMHQAGSSWRTLAEIAPAAMHPVLRQSAAELLARLDT